MESLGLAPPAPPDAAAVAAPAARGDPSCAEAEGELARLRVNPSPDEVAAFSRRLACEDLRPQVRRLMDSLSVAPAAQSAAGAAPAAPATPDKPAKPAEAAAPSAADSPACRQEADALSRLRANPDPQAVRRFAQELKCEALKPQVARLLESVGD